MRESGIGSQIGGNLERQAGLADPTGANQRHEPLAADTQPGAQRIALSVSANQLDLRFWSVWLAPRWLRQRGRRGIRAGVASRPIATRGLDEAGPIGGWNVQRVGQALGQLHGWALHLGLELAQHVGRAAGALGQGRLG
jgi:hypothetical protein